MAELELVKVYNLGGRVIIADGARCLPKKVVEVAAGVAKKLFKMYPKELVEWGKELPSDGRKVTKMTLAQARALVAQADAEAAAAAEETGGNAGPTPTDADQQNDEDGTDTKDIKSKVDTKKDKSKGKK